MRSKNSDPPGESGGRRLPPHLNPRLGRPGAGRTSRAERPADERHDDGARPADRRHTPRVAVVTRVLAGVVSATLLVVSGWGWYLGQLAQATVNRTDAIPASGNQDTLHDGAAMNLLLVGQDGREDLTQEQLAELNAGANDSGGLNTDTMILVHLPADGSSASFVSFPRDSYVKIPGHGSDKLNAAYAYGYTAADGASKSAREAAGAQLLVQTISQLSGLAIDHYAEVDLLGFFELTRVVGGVQVNLCQAVDDREYSGAYFPAGPQTIAGADALKFVRQRHHLGANGRGDYDRIIRQQVFLAGVLRNMLSSNVLLSPGRQRELVGAAAQSLTVDQDLDLFQLATQMQSVTLDSITFQTVPYIGNARDDQNRDIIRLSDEDTLHRFFAQLSAEKPAETPAEPPATVAPSEVSVEVRNGSGKAGLAAGAKGELEAAGFTVTGTGNADNSDYARTVVRHAAGDEARAAAVAAQVPGSAVELDDTLTAGTVRLVLGKDFNGIGVAPSTQPAPDEVQGKDLRNAQDTSCIN